MLLHVIVSPKKLKKIHQISNLNKIAYV